MQRDPRETARRLYQTAASQGGYFTAAQAKQLGRLDAVRPCRDRMQRESIRLSAALVQRVLELAGEAE